MDRFMINAVSADGLAPLGVNSLRQSDANVRQ